MKRDFSNRSRLAGHSFAHVVLACAVVTPAVLVAQTRAIPIRSVTVPVQSKEAFATLPTVRGLSGERVLVSDPSGKRLLVFDSTMTTFTLTADSAQASGVAYPGGLFINPLMRFAGDSSLLVDFTARTYLVVDGNGKIARAMAPVKAADLSATSRTWPQNPGVDNQGRLIFRGFERPKPRREAGAPPNTDTRDTITIIRSDFSLRTNDTIGVFSVPVVPGNVYSLLPNGKRAGLLTINAGLTGPDEFAVLSDGTLGIVRDHNYSVDWLSPDGATSSTGRLPFEWVRQTDAMKQARIDSMKKIIDSVNATGRPYGRSIVGIRQAEGAPARFDTIIPTIRFAPLTEMADYPSPFRRGQVKADEDGNLWVLPTTTSLSRGGLLFDVISRKDGLHERVQLPVGYVLVGFGKGGVAYLGRNDATAKNWTLARVRVVRVRG